MKKRFTEEQIIGFLREADAGMPVKELLLNGAIEFLQYARGISELLADLVHESDVVDCRRMALSLEAIGALANMGMQCTALAHARMYWEKAGLANAAITDVARPNSE